MRELELLRIEQTGAETIGLLFGDSMRPLWTLEPPWRDNLPGESCIPIGAYECLAHVSPKFGPTYWLAEVPGRQEILFHAGNLPRDTRGCILLGLRRGYLRGRAAIRESRRAMHEFLSLMAGERAFKLHITERKC